MVSAQRGDGSPAPWVWTCSCPVGHEGDFCERCSARFKRTDPAEGPFSSCQPCDPQTGDCYSADEMAAELRCPPGFYRNRWDAASCLRCPCPEGVSCTVQDGSGQPQCDRCPPGTTGSPRSPSRRLHQLLMSHSVRSCAQVAAVTSVRRVSTATLWEAEPAGPVGVTATSAPAFQEAATAAAANASGV